MTAAFFTARPSDADIPDWETADGRHPVTRPGLCSVARPCLARRRVMEKFSFPEATLIVVLNGTLTLDTGSSPVDFSAASGLCLVAAGTLSDICKSPAADGSAFRSLFLTFPPEILNRFLSSYGDIAAGCAAIGRGEALQPAAALQQGIATLAAGIGQTALSDARLALRVLELLLLLAEQGWCYSVSARSSPLARLRRLLQDAPQQNWTAKSAGQALGMSEATLRRRLAQEQVRFEALLRETRLLHGLLLLQTTRWSIARVAESCGYQSHARFSARFRERFNVSPSGFRQ